ncbi:hypothetical protein GQ457_18G013210 [Hibiscus cannabinus]
MSIKNNFVWMGSKDGSYFVKSGYFLSSVMDMEDHPSSSETSLFRSSLWKDIWKQKVSPKLLSFTWKLCHNIVPTRGTLKARFHGHCQFSASCPRCGEKEESIEHIIFLCPFAQVVWKASWFNYLPNLIGFPGFTKWWCKILMLQDKGNFHEGCDLIVFLCWSIWKSRNAFVFSSVVDDHVGVWHVPEGSFQEFMQESVSSCTKDLDRQWPMQRWTPPAIGIIKINFDVSFDFVSGEAGAGVIAHDHLGVIIKVDSVCFTASSASAAEAFIV